MSSHFPTVLQGKLVAIGEESDGLKTLTLKCWDLSALTTAGTTPHPLAAPRIFAISKLPDGSLTAAAADLSNYPAVTIALGTSTSAIHIFKGLDVTKTKLTAPFGRHVLSSGDPITAVYFAGSEGTCHVFAVCKTALVALSTATGQPLLEDDCGAAAGASAITEQGELLLAGQEAVYFYTAEEGRKAAAAIKGRKDGLVAYKHYIAATVPDDSTADTTGGGGTVLRIFDVANKVVAATAPVEAPLKWIVAGSRGVLAADASGAAVRFGEKSLEERLDSLYRSRSFQLALRIAQAEGAPAKVIADVRRYFGDFLYGKRDYDGATMQYAATVGVVEPSYVIQRFLDAQRLYNLTTYLEALHEAGIATADHTTLLLNCYTKLRDVAKLDQFVQNAGSPEGLKFDTGAAITVLHSAGYSEHAVFVALAAGDTDSYLSILLEDCKRYNEALQYIRGLGRRKAAAALHKFGKLLLQGDAVATTALLMELCLPSPSSTSASSSASLPQDQNGADGASYVANLADYTHLYTERPDDLRYACITILAMGHPELPSRQTLYHTLLDLYLSSSGRSSSAAGGDAEASAPQPQRYGSSTASMPSEHAEALDLLRRGWAPGQQPAYDVDRVLTTCRLHNFNQGLVFLYTNRREYREAANVLAECKDWAALLQLCEDHGASESGGDREIWHDALERLSSPAAGPGADSALRELLTRIESNGVMPPLAVLPVLGKNPHLKLEVVRDYVIRALEKESRAIAADAEEAERLKAEVAKAEATVKKLTLEPVVFQSSRDSQTGAPLELPSVHFLCGHSFNLRTLGDGAEAQECPLCAAEHRRVRELQRSYRAAANDKESFFRQLKAAPDGFSLVAEYFGKGMLNNTSVTTHK